MGRKQRRQHHAEERRERNSEPLAQANPTDSYMRFVVAFLIIFVLLWLFAPQDTRDE